MPAKLIYTVISSLDGYTADAQGDFDWSVPDAEVHAFVNDLERPIGTYLLGRRMYEVMRFWETVDDPDPIMQDYGTLWRAAEKIVYSGTLDAASTARTSIRTRFDADEVRQLLRTAESDVSIGGATLAAYALQAGLVDEVQQLLSPVIVGGGTRWLPDGLRLDLELLDERRFGNGVVYLRYAAIR